MALKIEINIDTGGLENINPLSIRKKIDEYIDTLINPKIIIEGRGNKFCKKNRFIYKSP